MLTSNVDLGDRAYELGHIESVLSHIRKNFEPYWAQFVPDARESFRDALERLEDAHPDYIEILDDAFLREYEDDGDLHSYVVSHGGGKGLAPEDAKVVALEIAQALKSFHENGVVHRDLKPQNVLRFGEAWKLTDFGIAKNTKRPVTVRTFQRHGTPGYAAPEQLQGVLARSSADVYPRAM